MASQTINSTGQEVIQMPGFAWSFPVTRAVAAHLMLKMGHDNKTIDALVFGYAKRVDGDPIAYLAALDQIPAECFANA